MANRPDLTGDDVLGFQGRLGCQCLIVGGGSAGALLAARLSGRAWPPHSSLVEAGGRAD
jgi:hypothetical protein